MPTLALALLSLVLAARIQRPPAVDLLPQEPPSTTALTTGGLFWSYSAGSLPPQCVLGDRGGQVLALTQDQDLLLLSSFDADPPAPIWTSPSSMAWAEIRAASDADVYLYGDVRRDYPFDTIGVLKLFRSRSSIPEWRYAFPEQGNSQPVFDISRDGRTVVSIFPDEATSTTVLRVHDVASGLPLRTIVHPQYVSPIQFDLSPDGTVAAFSSFAGVEVYELGTGLHLFTAPGYIPDGQALSIGGRFLATYDPSTSVSHVRVYARNPGGYQLALDVTTTSTVRPRVIAVSDDGSTLVGGWADMATPQRAIVRAYDVATAAMTMEHVDVAISGTMFPFVVAVSADGSRFVVGLHGEGAGAAPELAIYSRSSNQPLASHPNGGSIFSVDISPDGKRYLASRAPTNRGYDHTAIELYELGGEDMVVRGRPSVGETITFELHAAAGLRAWLLRSFSLAPTPIDVPGVGTLHLDPGTLSSTSMGVVPASGVATLSTIAETVPGMIGRTVWFQGLTALPRTLSTDFVQLTIVP